MNIASTQYSLKDKSFEIYISGCREHPCKGCHNPLLWNEDYGELLTQKYLDEMKLKVKKFNNLINKISIYGGEPLEKPIEEVIWLLKELKQTNKEIWLFTRFEINEIQNKIKKYCNYIKTGKYDEAFKTESNIHFGIKLASSNQKIYKMH
ncbi:MAG: 4Fe-4S cluster-binding domain-containing protein [Firmicutes bacterium]|nr:4Fe-4S cluster-binding domain-containing protein [Bacillota bacterium]